MTNRRGFLNALFTRPAAPAAVPAPVESRRYLLNDRFIAGFQHHEGPRLLAQLRAGDPLELVPELTNFLDVHAVRIEHHGSHLGYVPREQTRAVSQLLKQGAPVECSITSVTPTAPLGEAVRVQVSIPVATPTP